MNQHSSLMRYKSAPSSLLSKYLDFQDWNDISGNCLNSIAESEGPGSVFDDPYESPRSKAVEKSPEIVGTTGSVKDVHMLDCFDPEASLDIFNLPDLADTWHPSEESKCQQEERTAKLAFADSIENVGCLSTSGVKRESTSPPTVTDRLNLRMAGVLRSTPHTHNSFIKEPVFQTTVKEASKIHSNDSKTSKSTLEGISSDVQMMNLYEKDGVTMLPSPYSLDFAVYPSIGFIKPEQTPYGRNNENCAPLARSSSLPVSTTSKNIMLDNTSHYLGPCQTRAKRGCATHPRSIAERLRRTRISEKMKKLQELVPTSDKQLNTADMLDEAVEYVKFLQQQVKELSKDHREVPMKTAELCESQQ